MRADQCPAGQYQDADGQTGCKPCARGSYCKEGSATPIPCPGGTYNNRTGQSSVAQCVEVTVGFWAPLGSSLPEECPPSGFYCPGAAADTVNAVPGSKPIIQETGGSTEQLEVPVVETTIEVNLTREEFTARRDAIIAALAVQYGVDASQITLDAADPARRRRRQLQPRTGAAAAYRAAPLQGSRRRGAPRLGWGSCGPSSRRRPAS